MPKGNPGNPKRTKLTKRSNNLFSGSNLPKRSQTELTRVIDEIKTTDHTWTQSNELLKIGKALLAQGHLKDAALVFGLTKIDEHRAEAVLETAKKLAELGLRDSAKSLLYNVLKFDKNMQYEDILLYHKLVAFELGKLGFLEESKIEFQRLLERILAENKEEASGFTIHETEDIINKMLSLGFITEVVKIFDSKRTMKGYFESLAEALVNNYSSKSVLTLISGISNKYYKAMLYFKLAEKTYSTDKESAIKYYQRAMSEISEIYSPKYDHYKESLKTKIITSLLNRNLTDGALLLARLFEERTRYEPLCTIGEHLAKTRKRDEARKIFEEAIEDAKKSHDPDLELTLKVVPKLMDAKFYDLAQKAFSMITSFRTKIECQKNIIAGYLRNGFIDKAIELYSQQRKLIEQLPKDGKHVYAYESVLLEFIESGQIDFVFNELEMNPTLRNRKDTTLLSCFRYSLRNNNIANARKAMKLIQYPELKKYCVDTLEKYLRQQKVLQVIQRKRLRSG